MNSPKRHHFVPRFLLENFCDQSGMLWVRRLAGGSMWRAAPQNVFVEQHRYSTIEEDGCRSATLERDYADLEGGAKPIVDRMIAAARAGSPVALAPDQRAVWDAFFYHQLKRVPAVTRQLAAGQGWSRRLEEALARLAAAGIVADEATLATLRSPEGLADLAQNATVKALRSPASAAVDLLLGVSGLRLGLAAPGTHLVMGDRPIVNAASGIGSTTALWLPLSPDVAVRHDPGGGSTMSVLSADQVTEMNAAVAAQSEQIAGRDRGTVASIRSDP